LVAGPVTAMWPEAVERIAIFLRASGVEGQLEELLDDAETPPGVLLQATAFECGAGLVVGLVPAGRTLDEGKLARAAGCPTVRPTPAREFPFQGAKVFLDRTALTASTVWLEVGSPRHLLGLVPAHLVRLIGAETRDLVAES
jgi:prolyl-tRNA editing enzyme YbaK/EbsC (Cys-tRNA(Pro) deacylase)